VFFLAKTYFLNVKPGSTWALKEQQWNWAGEITSATVVGLK